MKKLIIIALFGLILSPDFALSQTIDPNVWDGKIYVKIKNIDTEKFLPDSLEFSTGNFMSDIEPFENLYGLTKISKPFEKYSSDIQMQKTYLFEFTDINKIYDFIFSLLQLPYVEYAERVPLDYIDCTTTNEALNYWSTPSQTYNLDKVQLCDAWDISVGDPNIVIAIIDNEIQMNHEDLVNKLTTNSFNVADNNTNTSDFSLDHGTHVAGIAGAEVNNSLGISGAARESRIMAVKVTLSGFQSITHGYIGILYAIQNNADVINTSWGGETYSITHQNIINIAHNSGCVIVASAGNESWTNEKYPAAYNNVIAVGSTDENDVISNFSNRGTWIDVMAPGSNIYSAINTSASSYDYKNGTSMAAPLVAGICALIKSVNPNLSNTSIENCLLSSVDNIDAQNPSLIGQIGSGRVNALNAVNCAVPTLTQNIVDFTSQFSACSGQPVTFFDNSSLTGTVLNYSWSFSCPVSYLGGTNSNSQNPIITFPVNGNCDVTLEVTTTDGIYNITKPNFITIEDLTGTLYPTITTEVCTGSLQQIKIVFSGGIPPYNTSITYNGITYNISSLDDVTYFYYTVVDGANTVTLNPISGTFCSNNTTQTLTINPIRCCDDLVFNGDFELGNTGFTSDQPTITIVFPDYGINCPGYSFVDEFSGLVNPNYNPFMSYPNISNKGNSLKVISPRGLDQNPIPLSCPLANLLPTTYTPLTVFSGTVPNHGEIIWQQSGISLSPNSNLHIDFYSTEGNPPDFYGVILLPLQFRVIISQGLTTFYTSPIIQNDWTELHSWQQHSLMWNTGSINSGNYDVRIEQYENFGFGGFYEYTYLIDDISIRQETFDLTTSSTNATCLPPNSDGTASVVASGGVAPYSYLWSDGQTTSTATGLDVGTFSVNVTDASGCQNNASVNVIQNFILFDIPYQTSITGNVTWNQSLINVDGEVYVEDGATLTIANGTRVEFSHRPDPFDILPNGVARLIVRPGGNLIVEDNVVLTGCGGGEWDGIRVLGTGIINNGIVFASAVIGAATIENAYIGVANFDFPKINQGIVNNQGGRITATGTTFNNNRTGIYTRRNINGVPYLVNNCNFVYDQNTLYSYSHTFTDEPTHIYLDETINFTATANNYYGGSTNFPAAERGYGISCFDCKININNPVAGTQQFSGLTRAINANYISSANMLSVNNVNINNCQEGIYMQGSSLAELKGNFINIPPPVFPNTKTYGIFSVGSDGFDISNNTFDPFLMPDANAYGMVFENSGAVGGVVFNNTFNNVGIGLQAQKNNQNLKVGCNNFNNPTVTSLAVVNVPTFPTSLMRQQGLGCAADGNPAGNEWIYSCNTSTSTANVFADNNVTFKYYSYNSNQTGQPYTKPLCSEPIWEAADMMPYICFSLGNKTPSSCASIFRLAPPPPLTPYPVYFAEIQSLITDYKNQIDILKPQLEAALQNQDGGDTQYLLSKINQGHTSNGQLKNLLTSSGALSDEVMIAVINKTPSLPPGILKDILYSQAPLSVEVLTALEELYLPNGIKNNIYQAQTNTPQYNKARDIENDINYLNGEIILLESEYQRKKLELIGNTCKECKFSNSSNVDILATQDFATKNEPDSVRMMLNVIQTDTTMDATEKQNFVSLMTTVADMLDSNQTIYTANTSQIASIQAVATTNTKAGAHANAGLKARKLPNHHYKIEDIPVNNLRLINNEEQPENHEKTQLANTSTFILYPNPNTGNFYLQVNNLEDENSPLLITVSNLLGQVQLQKMVNVLVNTPIEIKENSFAKGIYLVSLSQNNKVIGHSKLIIE